MSDAAQVVNKIAEVAPLGTSFLPNPQDLELFRGPDGELPRNAIQIVRGRGRPKNARNKRSKAIADYYVQRYGDPLDAIGQLANTPLRQLVDVLMEADGGAEHRERLTAMVEEAVEHIKSLRRAKRPNADIAEAADDLTDAIDKLARAAQAISGKPGKTALDALALQMQSHFKALEYVHGKQPIAVDVRKSADVVVVAPELLKEYDIDPVQLAAAIAERGLEALDADNLRLVSNAEDGEFTDADDGGAPGESTDK